MYREVRRHSIPIRRSETQGPGPREHSQAEHGLHGDEQGRHVEGLEEHLRRLLPVLTRVERRFRKKNRMLQATAGLWAGAKATCRPHWDLSREPPTPGAHEPAASHPFQGCRHVICQQCLPKTQRPLEYSTWQPLAMQTHTHTMRGGRDPHPHSVGRQGRQGPPPTQCRAAGAAGQRRCGGLMQTPQAGQGEGAAAPPPRRRFAAGPWSRRTARCAPCRSSPSPCRAPWGSG